MQSTTAGAEAVRNARHLLESVTITWAQLQVRCAEMLLAAGSAEQVEREYAELQTLAGQHGLTSSAAYAGLARAFHYAVVADPAGLAEVRHALLGLGRGDEFAYLCEIVDFWAGAEADPVLPRADWLDGREATMIRWQSIVSQRQRELAEA